MKITNFLSLNIRSGLCALTLFISISFAFATNVIEDKPLKEGASQKTETSKVNNSTDVSKDVVACQPKNCVPITITKSKTLAKSAEVFSSFLADSTVNISVTANNSHIIYEYGLRFVVTKKGEMVKVGSRLPKAGTYRISIWDINTKTVIAQQYVAQITDNVQSWADIPPLSLDTNKEYFISIISDNWNDAYPKSGSTVTYPIIKGNLKVLAFAYASQPTLTSPPRYPDMEDNIHSISGFVDFGFIPN